MSASSRLTRREILRKGLLFSAALMAPRFLTAQTAASPNGGLQLFCFGDWGAGGTPSQAAVAKALQDYAQAQKMTPDALFLLGDNFYGPLPGIDSPRWQAEFEEMYPARAFPGPCYALLGNHDYTDQPGGAQIQLDYARKSLTRWKMPRLWHRLELPEKNPVATFLCTNTYYAGMTPPEIEAQQAWLDQQLSAPRTTPWRFVCGHHPVVSCNARQDSKHLAPWRELFYQKGVDAYLCGHEHDLQHLHEEGRPTHWFVSGGGGMTLHRLGSPPDMRFAQMTHGFLHLAVTPQAVRSTFVGADAKPLYTHLRERGA